MATATPFGMRIARGVIRRACTETTHQSIAFDAVAQIAGPHAVAWERMFLAHGALLALGAAAPDTEFRDFRNHVVCPRDGYWGGAIAKAQSWYLNLTVALGKGEWQHAAYCAGVLCHYVTDALHPLHTGQSEAENDIHAALDHCVWKSYAQLVARRAAVPPKAIAMPAHEDFLSVTLASGAETAHAFYEKLLAHFHFGRAVTDARTGLDTVGQRVMTQVLATTIDTCAAIIDRAIADAKAPVPDVALATAGMVAALRVPVAAWRRAQSDRAAQRRHVIMFDELTAHGRVECLDEEERVKRDLYAREVSGVRIKPSVDNVFPFTRQRPVVADAAAGTNDDDTTTGELIVLPRARMRGEVPRPAPPFTVPEPIRRRADVVRRLASESDDPPAVFAPPPSRAAAAVGGAVGQPRVSAAAAAEAGGGAAALGHAAAASLLAPGSSTEPSFRDRRASASKA